jgi:hypothetical protein
VRVKSITLYSLPYVVGVASFLVAAQPVAPSLKSIGLWDTSTKNEIYSGQTVNRSLKRNRLPIQRATPRQAPEKDQIKAPIPSKETAEIVIAQHNGLSLSCLMAEARAAGAVPAFHLPPSSILPPARPEAQLASLAC